MLQLDDLLKKHALFYAIGMALIMFTSCGGSTIKQTTFLASFDSPQSYTLDNSILLSLYDMDEANKMGRGLLEQHNVKDNQTIRFPYKDYIFQSHGAHAITSVKDAQSKYPSWPIPERLDSYQFVDFTIYRDRTSIVFPDISPRPKDTIEVFTHKEPAQQYYLCYKNGSCQFRINVLPITEEKFQFDDIQTTTYHFTPFPSHPRAYFDPKTDDDMSIFLSLWISPEPDGKYAFYIHKISGSDCLESEDIPFTKEEASSIYKAIQSGFSKIPLQ